MEITWREMTRADFDTVYAMMRAFYTSPAVLSDGSDAIYRADIEACLTPGTPLTGYVFTAGERLVGYAMTAESFSTEFGRPCLWLEDLYLVPEARGQGAGSRFLQQLAANRPDAVLRLEAERENTSAVRVYTAAGFEELPYLELIRHPDECACNLPRFSV